MTPSIMVIFGITGDLSKRYLLPALYHLCKDDLLPQPFRIVGTSRQPLELHEFLGQVELCVLEHDNVCDPVVLKKLRDMMELVRLDPVEENDYRTLRERLDQIESEQGICLNRLYYLSIPPQLYSGVINRLGTTGLNGSCRHDKAVSRLLVEKPFGYDLASAEQLIEETAAVFSEEQTYRIDHYLAKETVQDILLFRTKNPTIEARWNSTQITRIEITAYETVDIGTRHFYDEIGALRDIIQSHLWQLLGLTVMELPERLDSAGIHASKTAALRQIGPLPHEQIATKSIRAQYVGYRQQVGNLDSGTETFAALDFTIETERWQGTKFFLATGKALNEKCTEICIHMKDGAQVHFRVQPEPGIELQGNIEARTDFSDKETPLAHANPDAYERVLVDAIRGDQTLFAAASEILASWHSLQTVLDSWAKDQPSLATYKKGAHPSTVIEKKTA